MMRCPFGAKNGYVQLIVWGCSELCCVTLSGRISPDVAHHAALMTRGCAAMPATACLRPLRGEQVSESIHTHRRSHHEKRSETTFSSARRASAAKPWATPRVHEANNRIALKGRCRRVLGQIHYLKLCCPFRAEIREGTETPGVAWGYDAMPLRGEEWLCPTHRLGLLGTLLCHPFRANFPGRCPPRRVKDQGLCCDARHGLSATPSGRNGFPFQSHTYRSSKSTLYRVRKSLNSSWKDITLWCSS